MRMFYILILFVFILSGCNTKFYDNKISENKENKQAITEKGSSWLESYNGDWEVNDLFAYFFPHDPGESIDIDEDNHIGMKLTIDAANNLIVINGENRFNLINACEVTSEELSIILFAPKWGYMAKEMASVICGGFYDKNGHISEGIPVKCVTFTYNLEDSDIISLIISAEGDLLLKYGEAGGTYSLLRD